MMLYFVAIKGGFIKRIYNDGAFTTTSNIREALPFASFSAADNWCKFHTVVRQQYWAILANCIGNK